MAAANNSVVVIHRGELLQIKRAINEGQRKSGCLYGLYSESYKPVIQLACLATDEDRKCERVLGDNHGLKQLGIWTTMKYGQRKNQKHSSKPFAVTLVYNAEEEFTCLDEKGNEVMLESLPGESSLRLHKPLTTKLEKITGLDNEPMVKNQPASEEDALQEVTFKGKQWYASGNLLAEIYKVLPDWQFQILNMTRDTETEDMSIGLGCGGTELGLYFPPDFPCGNVEVTLYGNTRGIKLQVSDDMDSAQVAEMLCSQLVRLVSAANEKIRAQHKKGTNKNNRASRGTVQARQTGMTEEQGKDAKHKGKIMGDKAEIDQIKDKQNDEEKQEAAKGGKPVKVMITSKRINVIPCKAAENPGTESSEGGEVTKHEGKRGVHKEEENPGRDPERHPIVEPSKTSANPDIGSSGDGGKSPSENGLQEEEKPGKGEKKPLEVTVKSIILQPSKTSEKPFTGSSEGRKRMKHEAHNDQEKYMQKEEEIPGKGDVETLIKTSENPDIGSPEGERKPLTGAEEEATQGTNTQDGQLSSSPGMDKSGTQNDTPDDTSIGEKKDGDERRVDDQNIVNLNSRQAVLQGTNIINSKQAADQFSLDLHGSQVNDQITQVEHARGNPCSIPGTTETSEGTEDSDVEMLECEENTQGEPTMEQDYVKVDSMEEPQDEEMDDNDTKL